MGDETVQLIVASLERTRFANNIDQGGLDAVVDTLVNRMRSWGFSDAAIRRALAVPTEGEVGRS